MSRQESTRGGADREAGGISRALVVSADDAQFMQEQVLSLLADEQQQSIEHVHPYGFSAVPQPPTGTGTLRRAAEAVVAYLGGGRSHGMAIVTGDRRFRLYKLAAGEVALHDDQGHQIHISRSGMVHSSPNSKNVVHQVMQSDSLPQDAANGQTAQSGKPVVAKNQQDKDAHTVSHTKTVNSNVSTAIPPNGSGSPAGNIASQISGLVSQAQALVSGGVGLPGINAIGSQIATMASGVTGSGASVASSIAALGTSMASSGMAGMSSILSSMSPLVSQLGGILNPAGIVQALHEHNLDIAQGILSSAFSGQHSTMWSPSGLMHASVGAIMSNAPRIPLNGNVLASDNLSITKIVTAANLGTTSDERLKSNIQDMPPVLDRLMQTQVKTFHKRFVATNERGEHSIHEDGVETFGFIAQRLRELFPELVRGNETKEFLSVDEPKVGIVALAALQEFVIEQRREIADLKSQIAALTSSKS